MMHIVWTVLIGFLAGVLAKMLTPGPGPGGFLMTAVLGIAGSVAASYVGQALGWYASGQLAGFLASVCGAVLLLLLFHVIAPKRNNASNSGT